jgi:hypothetical protein
LTKFAPDVYKNSLLKISRSNIPNLVLANDYFILIISLALLLFSASSLFEGANRWVYWLYDDTEHLSIAYNLFHGKGLTRDFIDHGAASTEGNIPNLMLYDQISNPLRSKPPLHMVLLGGWLYITGANYTNWFFLGSMFNLILGSIAIIIFYFFTKRHFGIQIAAYSTPILALMPPLIWYSVRVRPDLLAFIFIILSFYFVAKKITGLNMIIVGLFCGLAHLSHPIGLLPGSALIIYLLIFKRKFKATIILAATWSLIIMPWMVRNYIVFGDAIQGLGLPIPRGISTALGLISPGTTISGSSDIGSVVGIPLTQTMMGALDEFTHLYGMQFFLVFIACSLAAYLSFPVIKRALSSFYTKIFLILSIVIYARVVMWAFSFGGLPFQFLIFIAVPLIIYLGIRFFSTYKDIFTIEGKDIYTILAIFVILNSCLYLIFVQTTGRVVPEIRIIVFSLFMLIPLAIIGLKKLLEAICALLIPPTSIRNEIIGLSTISILLIFCFTQISSGISSINAFQNQFAESEQMKLAHKWIKDNIPLDAKIGSNLPHAILLRTGHEAVNFATAYMDDELYKSWIVKKFDIDYLVFYYGGLKKPAIPDQIDLGNIEVRLAYHSEGILIYKVTEIDN